MARQKVEWKDLFTFVGLDASVLMEMLLSEEALHFFRKELYSFEENLLFTHRICLGECLGLLVGNYNFPKEEVRRRIQTLIEEFSINILEEETEDAPYVFNIGKKYGWEGEVNRDAMIISAFWRKGINIVIVRDAIFEKVCKELKIMVIPFPKFS